MFSIKSAVLVLVVSASSGAIGYQSARTGRPEILAHDRARSAAISRHAEVFPAGGAVVIGDSITEFAYAPTLCGRPLLNAGIAGSRVVDWKKLAPRILGSARPAMVIFALGINDAKRDVHVDPDAWEAEYRTLVRTARGAHIAIMGVHPIEAELPKGPLYDGHRAGQLNARARAVASSSGALFLAPPVSMVGKTSEGVHLNETGRNEWVQRLSGACTLG